MNGGRTARGSEFAYHRAAVPPMNISGAEQMTTRTAVRGRLLIQAFAKAPSRDKNSATTGSRTRASEAASSVFCTRNPPGSFIPLAANASRSHSSTRASKVRPKTNPTPSNTRVPTIAHHTPATIASRSDPVRSVAAEPVAPSNASVRSTGLITRAKLLADTNNSITWLATSTAPNRRPAIVPRRIARSAPALLWYRTQVAAIPYVSSSATSSHSRRFPVP